MNSLSLLAIALGFSSQISALAIDSHDVPGAKVDIEPRTWGWGSPRCLERDVIQSNSAKTGQEPGTEGIGAGQKPSAT